MRRLLDRLESSVASGLVTALALVMLVGCLVLTWWAVDPAFDSLRAALLQPRDAAALPPVEPGEWGKRGGH